MTIETTTASFLLFFLFMCCNLRNYCNLNWEFKFNINSIFVCFNLKKTNSSISVMITFTKKKSLIENPPPPIYQLKPLFRASNNLTRPFHIKRFLIISSLRKTKTCSEKKFFFLRQLQSPKRKIK